MSYSSYDHDNLETAETMKIERRIYFESEKSDLSGLARAAAVGASFHAERKRRSRAGGFRPAERAGRRMGRTEHAI